MHDTLNSLSVYGARLRCKGQEFPIISLLLCCALIYAGGLIAFHTTARENAIPLWLLAVALAWRATEQLQPKVAPSLKSQLVAWGLIALVPFALQMPSGSELNFGFRCAMTLLALSVITYRNGFISALLLLPVLILTLVIIPIQEQLFLAISYPLRLISTMLTVETLQVFGCDITYQLTTIRVGEFHLAITDACSGISQLAVLLLLGYIVVIMKQHRSFGHAALHYLALLPVVIFANTIRLVITILLFYAIGDEAFGNTYHATLGYAFVILATSMFYALGALFPSSPTMNELPEIQESAPTKD